MNQIKICCLHSRIHNVSDMVRYLGIENIESVPRLTWNEECPDIVIATEHIYRYPKYFKKFKKIYKRNKEALYIFQAGEAVEPDLNIFDYSIVFSCTHKDQDRIIRIPPSYFCRSSLPEQYNTFTYEDALSKIRNGGIGFCNFIYSNPNAHPYRDSLFYLLSKYKTVSSLGGHLNNTQQKSTRNSNNWAQLSIEMKSKYKFSIACENEIFNGYTSEKILTSFQAHSIPIYWGNPFIEQEFNPEAFLNCHNYQEDELLEKIIQIDQDDELAAKMLAAPWQTEKQFEETRLAINDYHQLMNGVFLNPQIRRPVGTFADMYIKWFFRDNSSRNYLSSVINKIIKRNLK